MDKFATGMEDFVIKKIKLQMDGSIFFFYP
jgi:hypothetical protein